MKIMRGGEMRIATLAAFGGTLLLTGALSAGEPPTEAPSGIISRALVRESIKKNGEVSGELAKKTGWATATSFRYKILLIDKDTGKERSVRETDVTFEIGQQFLLEVECDADQYVWIYFIDKSGVPELLLPDPKRGEDKLLVHRDEKVKLPGDGTCFSFREPAGEDRLAIIVSSNPKLKVAPAEALKGKPSEKDVQVIRATLESVKKDIKARGFNTWRQRAENAQANAGEGTTVIAGSKDPKVKPDLVQEIILRSKK
jgi:hypothetical protein